MGAKITEGLRGEWALLKKIEGIERGIATGWRSLSIRHWPLAVGFGFGQKQKA
jgi:hypothetical protein